MIEIKLFFSANPAYFEVLGHSGYAEQGKDIVCAGVSAVTQTAYLGLTDVVGLKAKAVIDTKKGYLKVVLPSEMTDAQKQQADAILKTMRVGLIEFSKGYKSCVKLEEN